MSAGNNFLDNNRVVLQVKKFTDELQGFNSYFQYPDFV